MEIKRIFVVGAGLMGSGLAQTVAQSGLEVVLNDVTEEAAQKGFSRIQSSLEGRVAKGKMSEEEKDAALSHISCAGTLEKAATCQLVIEAAYENIGVKQAVYKSLDEICGPHTIYASNTSSISITSLASAVKHPENFIGMHFFSPVPVMKLLEITKGLRTSDETLQAVKAVGEKMNKVIIVSKDMPGFIVNRMLDPMINEAIEILDQGIGSVEDIDNGMKYGCNHPMGPLELVDMIGIDVHYSVMQVIHSELGESKYRPSPLLRKMVQAGLTGKKAKAGFYLYDDEGKKVSVNPIFAG